ncbi:MAG: metalloregulator ArsR/SmtB family transcription factor [Lachnospiraceae bacterium]|nr:metalloregulator ArsR/SmtB family transcription factor [Lachnospiraceae bacterium]
MALGDVERCEINEIHEDKVDKVRKNLPDEDEMYDLAELFKVFGDSSRIKILFALFEEEICVCDLSKALNMTQSAVSHQLKILKQARLVRCKRDKKQVIYFLADDHVRSIIGQGREHIEE